jgi:membrane protease subunit HflK
MMHQHHAHAEPTLPEEPLDAANQALADALKVSFKILKGIMVILVVLYLLSNVRCIGSHEQALVLRLGALKKGVKEPGMVRAWPFPVEEIVPLPTKKANTLTIDSHNFHRQPIELGKELDTITRGEHRGLHPVMDGSLMTADGGIVHLQWKITYNFSDVSQFVTNVRGDDREAAEELIKVMLETVGVHIGGEMTAEEIIRTKVSELRFMMKERLNQRLKALGAGLEVTQVDVNQLTPPLQVRPVFAQTQRAEQRKEADIARARKEATQRMNDAAGASHEKIIALLDRLQATPLDDPDYAPTQAKLDDVLRNEAGGLAGNRINRAGAYHARVVGQMQADLEQYRTLLPEYQRDPVLLIERLWQEARLSILNNSSVVKLYVPPGLAEFRVKIPRDPEQERQKEQIRLLDKDETPSAKDLIRPTVHSLGIGYD